MNGVLGQLGASKVKADDPNTYITSFIAHTVFGIIKAYILVNIIDSGLFKPNFNSLDKPSETSSNNNFPEKVTEENVKTSLYMSKKKETRGDNNYVTRDS